MLERVLLGMMGGVTDPSRVAGGYPGEFRLLPSDVAAALAAGVDTDPVGAERLRVYWTTGEGGRRIGWGSPGDWTRCVALLREHLGERAKGYCALRHHDVLGFYPGDRRNT